MRRRILLVGGSLNQTTMAHQVGVHLAERHDVYYTVAYADGWLGVMARAGWLDFTVLGGRHRAQSESFLRDQQLPVDHRGEAREYDLVVATTDLIVPRNVRGRRFVLLQEGMIDPENYRYRLVRTLRLPRYLANTSTTGLSHAYDVFCVASDGFRDTFVRKGVPPDKIRVTGIPNFDNVDALRENDFPHRDYVLAATSCLRETLKAEDRRGFIRSALRIADGRPLVFKLHPNERHDRATREVRRWAPDALVLAEGNTGHMIANCDTLVTKYSSVALVAAALGKRVHSDLSPGVLRSWTPLQNGGTSSRRIADICEELLQ